LKAPDEVASMKITRETAFHAGKRSGTRTQKVGSERRDLSEIVLPVSLLHQGPGGERKVRGVFKRRCPSGQTVKRQFRQCAAKSMPLEKQMTMMLFKTDS